LVQCSWNTTACLFWPSSFHDSSLTSQYASVAVAAAATATGAAAATAATAATAAAVAATAAAAAATVPTAGNAAVPQRMGDLLVSALRPNTVVCPALEYAKLEALDRCTLLKGWYVYFA
jgi:hypothetical protein